MSCLPTGLSAIVPRSRAAPVTSRTSLPWGKRAPAVLGPMLMLSVDCQSGHGVPLLFGWGWLSGAVQRHGRGVA